MANYLTLSVVEIGPTPQPMRASLIPSDLFNPDCVEFISSA